MPKGKGADKKDAKTADAAKPGDKAAAPKEAAAGGDKAGAAKKDKKKK
jgi:hypothetical protein